MTDHDNVDADAKTKTDYERQYHRVTSLGFYLAGGVFGVWLAFALAVAVTHSEEMLKGAFGDSFGFLTALFTGLALVGLWYTIQLQRIELSETRDVLADQAQTFEKQSEIQSTQLFEGTFFQLLRRLTAAQDDVRWMTELSGRAAVRRHYDRFAQNAKQKIGLENISSSTPESIQEVLEVFAAYLQKNQSELNHYFRILYHVFKFIENSNISEESKASYANLARAQLSTFELCLLFYNGLVGEGAEGMKPLIERFGLLKHVDATLLIDDKHKESGLYKGQAFMSYDQRKGVIEVSGTGARG